MSDILYNNIEGRIYRKNHNLAKFIAANPQIKDPNNTEVGEIIYFPDSFRLLSSIDPNTVLYNSIAEYRKPDESRNEIISGEQQASKNETKEVEKILNQSLVIGVRMNYESLNFLLMLLFLSINLMFLPIRLWGKANFQKYMLKLV